MKNVLIATLITLVSIPALADGFRCITDEGDLRVTVYNNVQPTLGTRNAAVMVLSDPAVQSDRKTIAVFKRANSTLKSSGAYYTGKVDLRYSGISSRGENICGTKLGYLKYVNMNVDFRFGENLENGEKTSAKLDLVKRDGKRIYRKMTCERYLKH